MLSSVRLWQRTQVWSPLLSELSAFHHERLLEALQAKHGKRIKDLKFKRLTSRS